jgi:hypothetical protein
MVWLVSTNHGRTRIFCGQKNGFPFLHYAFSHFTILEKIILNTCNELYRNDIYDYIGPSNYTLEFPNDQLKPFGVRQLNCLVAAIASDQMKLRKLRVGLLSWEWSSSTLFVFNKDQIYRAYESLTSLHLVLNCGSGGPSSYPGDRASECHQSLSESGEIHKLLVKMLHLESLMLKFDWMNIAPTGRRIPTRLDHLIEDGFRLAEAEKACAGRVSHIGGSTAFDC